MNSKTKITTRNRATENKKLVILGPVYTVIEKIAFEANLFTNFAFCLQSETGLGVNKFAFKANFSSSV